MQEKDKLSDYLIFYRKHENTLLIHQKIQESGPL